MDRRRSKKLGELSTAAILPSSRPRSGISFTRQRKGKDGPVAPDSPTSSVQPPVAVAMTTPSTPVNERPETSNHDNFFASTHSIIVPKPRNQPRREDLVLKMMEDGTIEGIMNIVAEIANIYLRSVPAANVIDELTKVINEEQGTQKDLTAKMAALDVEASALEKTIAQLQHDHDELKQMDEVKVKLFAEKNTDLPEAKHTLEEKLKKTKALKGEKTRKK